MTNLRRAPSFQSLSESFAGNERKSQILLLTPFLSPISRSHWLEHHCLLPYANPLTRLIRLAWSMQHRPTQVRNTLKRKPRGGNRQTKQRFI